MKIWEILGIEPVSDIKLIKKAYHKQLRNTNPEDNQEAFMRLREAYENALEYAAVYTEEEYEEYEEYDECEEVYETEIPMSEKEKRFADWCVRLADVYTNYQKRLDVENWRKLLYEDIPFEITYYTQCRQYIYSVILYPYRSIYLPREIRMLLDNFFTFCGTSLEQAMEDGKGNKRRLNKKFKLCENIEFDKVIIKNNGNDIPDRFFVKYEHMTPYWNEFLPEEPLNEAICYLPSECIFMALNFKKYSEREIEEKIEKLKTDFGNAVEIQLLIAEYMIYQGKINKATEQLTDLFKNIPLKNYVVVYQMAVCCEKVFMFYEAYMLIKHLTWLNPQPFMYDMAENIYHKMEEQYLQKKYNGEMISDLEYVRLCRIYLRSEREEDAVKILKEVKEPESCLWEYEVAHSLCIFYEEAKKEAYPDYGIRGGRNNTHMAQLLIEQAIPGMEKLESYPKESLNGIEKLEWEELQARYLFEQRKYEECEAICQKLLEEYPLSYPILLLRGYVDFNKNLMGYYVQLKDYMDFNYLSSVLPRRTEARLMAANIMMFYHWNDKACYILSPIKDKVPDQYAYYEMKRTCENNDEKLAEGIMELFTKSKQHKLSIPPCNKYGVLDLHNIFIYACRHLTKLKSSEIRRKLMDFLEGMKDSKFNHPEEYMDWYWFYDKCGNYVKAVEIAQKKLKTEQSQAEAEVLRCQLFKLYCWLERVEEAEAILPMIPVHLRAYGDLGIAYYNKKNYEKALFYLSIRRSNLNMYGYFFLANTYYKLKQYEKALDTLHEGIKIWNKSGDYDKDGNNINLYYEIVRVYCAQEKWEEAFLALEEMRTHTHLENVKKLYFNMWVYLNDKLQDLYNREGRTDEAIEAKWRGIEESGGVGDYSGNRNIYRDLYFMYIEQNNWKEAGRIAELMNEHTQIEEIKREYPVLAAYAAINRGDFEIAYDKFKMVKENPEYFFNNDLDMDINLFLCCYGMGRYDEAYTRVLDYSKEHGMSDASLLMCALHSQYMKNGTVDKTFACEIEQAIKKIMYEDEEKKGDCMASIVEIYAVLGDEEQANCLKEEAYRLLKEQDDDYEENIAMTEGWLYAYKKDYKKAYEITREKSDIEDLCSNTLIECMWFKSKSEY